jgi:hypothetical protein
VWRPQQNSARYTEQRCPRVDVARQTVLHLKPWGAGAGPPVLVGPVDEGPRPRHQAGERASARLEQVQSTGYS